MTIGLSKSATNKTEAISHFVDVSAVCKSRHTHSGDQDSSQLSSSKCVISFPKTLAAEPKNPAHMALLQPFKPNLLLNSLDSLFDLSIIVCIFILLYSFTMTNLMGIIITLTFCVRAENVCLRSNKYRNCNRMQRQIGYGLVLPSAGIVWHQI